MNQLITSVPTGFTAFTATNLDDIVILLLFFSQVNAAFRRRHIVTGQYLGFAALVVASLPGFFGTMIFPRPWIGLLGLIPIAIGLSRLVNPEEDDDSPEAEPASPTETNGGWGSFLSPQTYSVAAVTFANGGDNIGIYAPLFASISLESLLVILGTFFSLVGVWCYTAYQLTRLPAIASSLTRYGNYLVPYVCIGLGVVILANSHTLENPFLASFSLLACGAVSVFLFRNNGLSEAVETGSPSLPEETGTELKRPY